MGNFDIEKFPASETGKRMLHRVSPVYQDSYFAKWMYQTMGLELDEAREIVMSLREQNFTQTVTWGIEFQEHKYSIEPDETLTLEQRRARLYRRKAKFSPMNPWYLETYIREMWGIECEVDETYAPGVMRLSISKDENGNLRRMEKDLRDNVKPSHLSMAYLLLFGFVDLIELEESRLWCLHVVNGTREDYPWRGRYFDTSWTFTDMPRFDGLWLYDGQYHFDGIPAGAEDEKGSRFCFDGAWWFGGDRCFGRPISRKILWGTAEPDELAVVPVTSIQERYLVELPFDVLTPFDTGWAFGARDGPQDARFDAGVAPALKEILEVLDHSDEAVTIVRAVLRDVYPLAHLLHFDGTWAFQPMLSFNGSWRLEQDPGYRYGGSRFEPWRNQPASSFGEQKYITETFYEEAALCFDGGWAFETAKVKYFGEKLHFDGSWSLGFTGERNFGEIIRLPHTTTIEAEYEEPRYDGSWKFFGLHSADAFWDEDAQERLSVLDSPVEAESLPVEEGIGWQTEAAFADTLLRVPVYDGTWGFHEVPVLGECPLLFEALPAFGSGIAFDGAWAFDRCGRAFDGTWKIGDCRLHFDGAWHFDGETFFASHDLKEEAGEAIRPVLAESICRSFGSGMAFDGAWAFAAEDGMGEGLAVFITEVPRFDGLWAFDDEARTIDGTWSLGADDYAFGDKASPRNAYDGSWKFTDPMNTGIRFERRWRSFGSITFAA